MEFLQHLMIVVLNVTKGRTITMRPTQAAAILSHMMADGE
jgi:hypothetical protein